MLAHTRAALGEPLLLPPWPDVDSAEDSVRSDVRALVGVGALALALGLGVAWILAGSIARPLRSLAAWHALRASSRLGDQESAERFFAVLPKDFPADLKMQIARETGGDLALKIYQDLSTREARLERAKLQNNTATFRNLIRESKDDDVALECARLVLPYTVIPRDQMDIAQVFVHHAGRVLH